jgi:hypothetical protein
MNTTKFNPLKAASSIINFALPLLSIASLSFPDHSEAIGIAIFILQTVDRHIQSSTCQKNL